MVSSRWSTAVALAAWAALAPELYAQQNSPRIGYVYPAGARQGSKFDVVVGGRNLDGTTTIYISGSGAEANLIGIFKPKMPGSPALAEMVTLQVAIAEDAPPGDRELRLATASGLTNPMVFHVGRLPEFRKKPPPAGTTQSEMNVTLPGVINGRILPGEVDRYRFLARKGERLVFVASARDLVPYLPDAVPGWFQAVLTLYDAEGNELACVDDYRFSPDPVLYYEVPKDGQYVIEIRDAIYRGREDFVYRLAAGELPFVTSIFPLGGKAGTPTTVKLKGWNLPVDVLTPNFKERGTEWLFVPKVDVKLSKRRLDSMLDTESTFSPEATSSAEVISNRLPFAVDTLPECLEQEPNNAPAAAQRITLPVIVNGRIDSPGDWDVFRVDGRAGQEVIAEVFARRLNSPLDSVLKLTDAAGRQLAFNDDQEDKGAGLITHHADSLLRAKLPADGTYYLHLGDIQRKGGEEYAYRLHVRLPGADFALRVVPSGVNVLGGATVPLTVFALRKDGFSGEIALALKDAPPGFLLGGARVPAGQDQVRVTLTAPPRFFKQPISLRLEGRAVVAGAEVARTAVPAEEMLQAFAYRHLVPANELSVIVPGMRALPATVTVLSPLPVQIPAGGTAKLQLSMRSGTVIGELHVELDEPPEGISIQSESGDREATEVALHADAAKVKPGLKGNLIVNAFAARPQGTGKPAVPVARRGTPLGMLPAIPFEIVPGK